jgi:DNA-binding transcriptional regulator YiaG
MKEIINRIERAGLNLEDDKLFKECILQTMQDIDLNDITLANLLAVSRSTVARWKNGQAVPHPLMKKPVYNILLKLTYDKFQTSIPLPL